MSANHHHHHLEVKQVDGVWGMYLGDRLVGTSGKSRVDSDHAKAVLETWYTSKWIPLSERYPSLGQWVHILINDVMQLMPARLNGEDGWSWLDPDADTAPLLVVSHWQALPEAPLKYEQK